MKANEVFINFNLDMDIVPATEILLLKENPQTVEGAKVKFMFVDVT